MLNLREAVSALEASEGVTVAACSAVYENPALLYSGDSDSQPDFLNAVVKVRTTLSPLALLEVMHEIEDQAGRVRSEKPWQARPLDLDLLLYEDLSVHTGRLVLPHPAMHKRRFVLKPLVDIDAEINIPYPVNKSAREALEDCTDEADLNAIVDIIL